MKERKKANRTKKSEIKVISLHTDCTSTNIKLEHTIYFHLSCARTLTLFFHSPPFSLSLSSTNGAISRYSIQSTASNRVALNFVCQLIHRLSSHTCTHFTRTTLVLIQWCWCHFMQLPYIFSLLLLLMLIFALIDQFK